MKSTWIGTLILFMSLSSYATWDLEQRKIDFLLASIEHLNATFIRSGEEYTGSQASRHLRMKLRQAQNTFGGDDFAPQLTVENFIEQVASKSYFTGQPYYIRMPNGQTMTARDWLYQQLYNFR